jgi:cellulose 1,4-beta-cellobiosidase
MIAQYYVGMNPAGFNIANADANCDGSVTIVDALVVAQYSVGLIGSIQNCTGTTPTPVNNTPTPVVTPGPTGNATHITGNPFVGATWFVDEIWSAKARANGGAAIANQPTMVWMDRIGAITDAGDGLGLRGYLDMCLAQGANLFQVSIYDLPNRDCSAAASSGELLISNGGMARYKAEYIDPIAAILADAKYQSIRIIALIEIDSLPNLITNMDIQKCQEASGDDGYVEGVTYALDKLSQIPNVYKYIDIAHSGWLGWDSNLAPMCDLLRQVAQGTVNGFDSVDGFASNTCNYTPLDEPYLTNADQQVGGQPVRSADFYEWNPYFDERRFIIKMHSELTNRGFRNFGMIHDTSRNGWGGSSYGKSRPTSTSTSTDLNTFVNQSKVDRRYHRGNWCNQEGGIGIRPQAAPFSQCDAYVWIKPPGESDGISQDGAQDPNDPAKTFDRMCDPNGNNTSNSAYGTGAMDAPHAGRWNQVQFDALLRNAYPAL